MFKLRDVCIISLLVPSLILFNSIAYADKGQGHSYGQGQGKAHGRAHVQGIQGKGHGYGRGKSQTNTIKSNKIRFVNNDRTTINKYFNANPFPVNTLPPGIAKNLLRGKPLPPGIAKVFLPSDLVQLLPAYPGYEYLVVGRDVLLVNSTSRIVEDILSNVLK